MQDQAVDKTTRTAGGKTPLLRALVLLLAIAEIATVGYVWYALYIDDTTSWVVLLFPETEDLRQALALPLGVGGGVALVLGVVDRWLWAALAIALAAPVVSAAWLFA